MVDLRPQVTDMTLCLNKTCQNKCKRYYEFWKPSQIQSYINPTMSMTYTEIKSLVRLEGSNYERR